MGDDRTKSFANIVQWHRSARGCLLFEWFKKVEKGNKIKNLAFTSVLMANQLIYHCAGNPPKASKSKMNTKTEGNEKVSSTDEKCFFVTSSKHWRNYARKTHIIRPWGRHKTFISARFSWARGDREEKVLIFGSGKARGGGGGNENDSFRLTNDWIDLFTRKQTNMIINEINCKV